MRIREHIFYPDDSCRWVPNWLGDKQAIALRIFNIVIQVAFFFVAKGFFLVDQKLKVARIGFVDVRIINLVHDAVTQRKPHAATSVIRRADALFALEVQRRTQSRAHQTPQNRQVNSSSKR